MKEVNINLTLYVYDDNIDNIPQSFNAEVVQEIIGDDRLENSISSDIEFSCNDCAIDPDEFDYNPCNDCAIYPNEFDNGDFIDQVIKNFHPPTTNQYLLEIYDHNMSPSPYCHKYISALDQIYIDDCSVITLLTVTDDDNNYLIYSKKT